MNRVGLPEVPFRTDDLPPASSPPSGQASEGK
jgi:hypothetical protein